jgi:polysaccharide export outer membrane protein/exopolysaccharide production protein ExoF
MMQKLAPSILVVALCLAAMPVTRTVAGNAEQTAPKAQYKLGPQDKVSVKVYEWRPSRDEVYEWTAFKADYVVSASGSLSLPLLGDVPANGMTTAELQSDLGLRLRDRMGLVASPDVTVEVVSFRPFYVVGAVEKPGEYPYRPDLNVLEAYALAGGRPRTSPARLQREAIATRGDLHTYALESQALRARMTRLQAELADAETLTWPAELQARLVTTELNRVLKQEKLVFDMRREAYRTQVSALQQLEAFLQKEATSLEKQIEVHQTEVASVRTELQMVQDLFKKGLTPATRKLSLERNMAQVDGDRLRLETNLMRARQEGSKTKVALAELLAKRNTDISAELQKTQSRLDELGSRMETSASLLHESEVLAPQALLADETEALPIFMIVRHGNGQSTEQVVSQDHAVQPGDTIIVEQPRKYPQTPLSSGQADSSPTASADISVPNAH